MPTKVATLFSCGGGFDCGAIAAGCEPVFALDFDHKAVDSYRQNIGDHIVHADIRGYDFTGIRADHLHASPSCKNASAANSKAGETDFDLDCAKAVCQAIKQINPKTFSLENVVPYAKFESFKLILKTLCSLSYKAEYQTLNAANYGVPQTRKRLILIAAKHGYPQFPEPTHSKPTQQKSLFELPDWVTWREAIEDIVPTLNETNLAPWQQRQVESSTLFHGRSRTGDNFDSCISAHKGLPRVVLVEKVGARSDRPLRLIPDHSPIPTLKALGQDGHWEQWVIQHGVRVLQTDIRCLARWQSFPPWYQFPKSRAIACSLIGNAVSPLLAQKIMAAIAHNN
jgi:DNA (cytosine-5)-methyltransferase 1